MKHRTRQIWLVVLLVIFATGCMEPKDRRPGMRLSGDVVNEAITDWSFSNEFQEIFLETKTWYMVPHSVTTVCATLGEKLYVPTVYFEGGAWPDKFWNSNVVSDSRVRVKIGDKIYPRKAVVVEDAAELQAALGALAAKYPFWKEQHSKPEDERPDMAMVRLDPRDS